MPAALVFVLLLFSAVLSKTTPELVMVFVFALPDDDEELTSPDPKFNTVPASSTDCSPHTFLYVHSILKHEDEDDDDELLELDEEEELLELEDEEEEELLELEELEEELLLLELLDDEEDDEEELEEELDEELDELEEELDDELEEELEEELDEELLIHRSSSIYGPLHVRSIDLDVGAGSFNFAVQW